MFLKFLKKKLILKYKDEINDKKVEEFRKLLKSWKMESQFNILLIIKSLWGLIFYVDENVLIPQPDTEILVEEVIKYCNELRNNESEDKRN